MLDLVKINEKWNKKIYGNAIYLDGEKVTGEIVDFLKKNEKWIISEDFGKSVDVQNLVRFQVKNETYSLQGVEDLMNTVEKEWNLTEKEKKEIKIELVNTMQHRALYRLFHYVGGFLLKEEKKALKEQLQGFLEETGYFG